LAFPLMAPTEPEEVSFEPGDLGLGNFDGKSFKFHSFPLPKEVDSDGEVDGVSFHQTMGRMVIHFPMVDDLHSISEQDLEVKLSCFSVEVLAAGKQISKLCKELHADVVRSLCWWEVEDHDSGSRVLVIFLAKAEHRAWDSPFRAPDKFVQRKAYPYRLQAKRPEDPTEDELKQLQILPRLDWKERSKHLSLGLWPRDFFRELHSAEDDKCIQVTISLDGEAMDSTKGRIPLEELFNARVTADSLMVTLGADSLPLCSLKLNGECVPELSAWLLTWRDPDTGFERNVPDESLCRLPVLRFGLWKAEQSRHVWGQIFTERLTCQRRQQFDPRPNRREAENLLRLLTGGNHDPGVTKQEKAHFAKKLCTDVEATEQGSEVLLKLQMEETFLQRCLVQQVNPYQAITIRFSDRFIHIGFRADLIYEVCLLGLGGRFEAVKSQKFNPNDCSLRITLKKAKDSCQPWEPIFSHVEPWQAQQVVSTQCGFFEGL